MPYLIKTMLSKDNININKKLFSYHRIDSILSDSSFIKKIILFELFLAKSNYEVNFIPYDAYKDIKLVLKSTSFTTLELQQNLQYSGVITLNIINKVRKKLKDTNVRFFHFGATSQDVMDTALILQLKDVKKIYMSNLKDISNKLLSLALNHIDTYTIGRTRNMHATLTTFGLKVTNWTLPILRNVERLDSIYNNSLLSIQFGGAVGNLSSYGKKGNILKRKLAKYLDLNSEISSWHNQRDKIIEFCSILSMITGAIAKVASDLLVLSQNELAEVLFKKSGTSSSMPHKSNPVIAELLVTLAKLNAKELSVMHDAIIHKNDRDGISWMMEWKALNSMLKYTGASLHHFNKCLSIIKVNKKNMQRNINHTYGVVMSDYYFQVLAETYSYYELKEIFPAFIQEALSKKKHLVDVIHDKLGNKLQLKKNISYDKLLGINNSIINNLSNKVNKTFL